MWDFKGQYRDWTKKLYDMFIWGADVKQDISKQNKQQHNMKSTRQEVYAAIDTERAYQDAKWIDNTAEGELKHSAEDWLTYISDYTNEAQHILSRDDNQTAYPIVMGIMRKIAALGVVAMEQLGAIDRIPDTPTV